MKKAKRVLAIFLATLMLFSSAPLAGFVGIELPDLPEWSFAKKANAAVGLSEYSATAAAEWATAHLGNYESVLFGKNYWYDGGDCANFVSQALYMGGMDLDDLWNLSGYLHWGTYYGNDYDGSFIRCQQLYNYLVNKGAQVIKNPAASQVSIGDVILYSAVGKSRMTHSAIVIDIKNGVPVLAAHSVDYVHYRTDKPERDWHLGFPADRTYLMKLNGSLCEVKNPQVFDVYVATGSDTRLYVSQSTSSGYYSTFLNGSSPDYAHVYSKSADGQWGYTFRYGKWGWIRLSQFRYLSHQETPKVTHDFGDWTIVQIADCQHDGLEKRVCRRCGLEETKTTKGGHILGTAATCLKDAICKVCNASMSPALGHNWNGGTVTKAATCTEKGLRTYTCTRDSSHKYSVEIEKLGHNYVTSGTAPTCTANGETIKKCSRCGDSYIASSPSYWTGWTDDTSLKNQLSSDRIQTKTQYRYYDKETTTSSSSSLSGWNANGSSSWWEQTGSGSFNYATFPSGFDTSHSIYTSFQKSPASAYDNGSTKREVSNSWAGYVYWHWMYDTNYANGTSTRAIFNKKGTGNNGYGYKYFGAFTSTKGDYSSSTTYCNSLGITNYIVPERTSWNDCQGATRWFRFDYYTSYYTDYTKKYEYYYWKWKTDPACDWTDSYIASTNDRKVETRTLYNYNLEKLGHNFTSGNNSQNFVNKNHLVIDRNEICYITGTGSVCTRCGLKNDENVITVPHSFTTAAVGGSGWTKHSDTTFETVWRAYCNNGCGCWLEEKVHKCQYVATDVIAPTCTEQGYTIYVCPGCGDTYNADYTDPLNHNKKNHYDRIPATCLTDGQIEYWQCDYCAALFADAEGKTQITQEDLIIKCAGSHVDPATVEWVELTPAGCGVTGKMKKYCDRAHDGVVCGAEIDSKDIPALPAQWYVVKSENAVCTGDPDLVTTDPEELIAAWKSVSCEKEGILTITCKTCENTPKAHGFVNDGSTYSIEYLDSLEHIPGEKTENPSAYCIYPGHWEQYCERCGMLLDEGTIDAPETEHHLVEIKAEGGCVYKMCTNAPCTYIEPGEHTFQRDPARDVAATCTLKGVEAWTCSKCGDPNDKETEALGHAHELTEEADADCINPGYEVYVCNRVNSSTVCGDTYTIITQNPLGHNPLKTDAKDPLCKEDGNYEYYTCQRENCGKIFFDATCYNETTLEYTVIPQLDHNIGDWYSNNNATHTRDCLRDNGCTYSETEDCKFGEWTQTLAPTCTEKGQDERICSVCDYIEYRDVAPLEHIWDDGVIDPVSTCDFYGTITYTCQRDNSHTYTDVVPLDPDNHVGETYTLNAETENCTKDGYTGDIYCSDCEALLVAGQIIPAYGHDMSKWDSNDDATHTRFCQHDNGCTYSETEDCKFGEWTQILAPTCTEKGQEKRVCSVCGYTEYRDVEPTDHAWDNGVVDPVSTCVVNGIRTYTCLNDSNHTYTETVELDENNHVGETYIKDQADATCTEDGYTGDTYCADCDKKLLSGEVIPAFDHAWDEGVIDPVSTCNTHGTKTFTCQNDNSHTYTEVVDLDGDNHVGETYIKDYVDATCTEDGYTGDTYCADCDKMLLSGEVIRAFEHDWSEWRVITEPTYFTPGKEQRDCLRGDATETRPIECLPIPTYTATFIAADANGSYEYEGNMYNLVKDVEFKYNDTSVAEPVVPEKEGYFGYWEDYELKNEDIIIKAVYELKSSDNESDLQEEKKVVNEDGDAVITLSAFAETLNAKVTLGATPYDIVLVLDNSGSMKQYIGKKTRMQSLREVAVSFAEKVNESAIENNVDHRVSIAAFSGASNGTGLVDTDGSLTYSPTTQQCKDAWLDAATELDSIKNTINHLENYSGTRSDLGLDLAAKLLVSVKEDTDRERLVLFITDGVPSNYGGSGIYDNKYDGDEFDPEAAGVAHLAITKAKELKHDYNAKIYSIGIATESDPSDVTKDMNKFMNYVSSNYPDAQDLYIGGEAIQHGDYYVGADDEETMKKVFNNIFAQQISNTISFTNITFVDTISSYFTLTLEQEKALREEAKAKFGIKDEDILIVRNDDGTTYIRIENVNPGKVFDEKGTMLGYGATLSFKVSPNKNAMQANVYDTNTDNAGIEHNGVLVERFEVPSFKIDEDLILVEYFIDGVSYKIVQSKLGSSVVAPDCDYADWKIPEGTTVEDLYTAFDTKINKDTKFTTTWFIDGVKSVTYYAPGERIVPPTAPAKEGYVFETWTPDVPAFMPSYPMTFTAVYKEGHAHIYESKQSGDCEKGIVTTYTCSCGDTYSETKEPGQHILTARINEWHEEASLASVFCSECGYYDEKVIEYIAVYDSLESTVNEGLKGNKGNKNHHDQLKDKTENTITNVINLTLFEGEVSVQPDADKPIVVMLPLTEELRKAKDELVVYRLNEDDSRDEIEFETDDTYLILYLDHFSYYVISTQTYTESDPSYAEADCAFNGHEYTFTVNGANPENGDTFMTFVCGHCEDIFNSDRVEGGCDCFCHSNSIFGKIIRYIFTLFNTFFDMNLYCCPDMKAQGGTIDELT